MLLIPREELQELKNKTVSYSAADILDSFILEAELVVKRLENSGISETDIFFEVRKLKNAYLTQIESVEKENDSILLREVEENPSIEDLKRIITNYLNGFELIRLQAIVLSAFSKSEDLSIKTIFKQARECGEGMKIRLLHALELLESKP